MTSFLLDLHYQMAGWRIRGTHILVILGNVIIRMVGEIRRMAAGAGVSAILVGLIILRITALLIIIVIFNIVT